MLLVASVIFIAIWLVGMISGHTWDGKLHLLLALAVTALILHLLQRRSYMVGLSASNPSHQRRDSTLLNRRK